MPSITYHRFGNYMSGTTEEPLEALARAEDGLKCLISRCSDPWIQGNLTSELAQLKMAQASIRMKHEKLEKSDLSVADIRKLKGELQRKINNLLTEFTNTTGVGIDLVTYATERASLGNGYSGKLSSRVEISLDI